MDHRPEWRKSQVSERRYAKIVILGRFVQARNGQLTADLRSMLGSACLPLLISPVWGRCDGHCVGVAFRTSSEGRPCGQAVRNDGGNLTRDHCPDVTAAAAVLEKLHKYCFQRRELRPTTPPMPDAGWRNDRRFARSAPRASPARPPVRAPAPAPGRRSRPY